MKRTPAPYESECHFCGGKHDTKAAYLRCTGDRRKQFAEIDAAMAKLTAPKKPKS